MTAITPSGMILLPVTACPNTTLGQLHAAVDVLRRECPHAGARLSRAAALLVTRPVERGAAPGHWWVGSESDPDHDYLVIRRTGEAPSCTCQDWARHGIEAGVCKHIAATVLLERLERAEADRDAPPLVPAHCPRCGRPTTARDASALAKMHQCARCTNELLWGPDDAA